MSRFSGFTQIILGLFFLTTQIPTIGYTQEANWFALSNGIGLTVDIDVDQNGSVYSLGDGRDEMEFRSANKNDKSYSAYVPFTSQFVMKHSSVGKLEYVLTIIGMGGSSNSTSATNLKILQDNRLAVTVYCKYKFRIVDAFSDSTEITTRGSHLLIFNPNGKLEEDLSLPLDYPSWLSQADNGEVIVLGRKSNSYYSSSASSTICKIDLNTKKVLSILADMKKRCSAIRLNGNTLWFLESEVTGSKHYSNSTLYTLYSMHVNDAEAQVKASFDFGLCRSLSAQIIDTKGKVEVMFSAQKALMTGIELNGLSYANKKDYSRWFVAETNGEIQSTFEVRGVQQGDVISGLKEGGYVLRTMVYDSLLLANNEPILPPKHENFVYELCFVKLSPDFIVEELTYSGGVSRATNAPFVVRNGYLYVASPLYGNNTIDNVAVKIPWSHGFFVRRVAMSGKLQRE